MFLGNRILSWFQNRMLDASLSEFHPDIMEILKVSFGSSIEDVSGAASRRADNVRYNLYSYLDRIFRIRNFVLYLHPDIAISRTAEQITLTNRNISTMPMPTSMVFRLIMRAPPPGASC